MSKEKNDSPEFKFIKQTFEKINAEIAHLGKMTMCGIEFTFVVPKTRDFTMLVSKSEFSEGQKNVASKYLNDEGFIQNFELINKEYNENDLNFSDVDLSFIEERNSEF